MAGATGAVGRSPRHRNPWQRSHLGAWRRPLSEITLFPFAQYWWFYLAFLAGVLVLLALDLGVFHREAHEVSFREAATWSIVWVSLALAFNYGLYHFALWKFPQDHRLLAIPGFDAAAAARETALEFLTGFVVEKSLSVDNIFVFVLILTSSPCRRNTSIASCFSVSWGR